MKHKNKFIIFAFFALLFSACVPEEPELSSIQEFAPYEFIITDKFVVSEADTTIEIPFTFDASQIFDLEIDIAVDEAKSTATEDEDFALGSHTIAVQALAKKGVISLQLGSDLFLESDESIFLTLTSDHPSGFPKPKTIEISLKNVGGCPAFVIDEFVGDFTVESDDWQDFAVGTTISVTKEGANELSFKYNCGDLAKPIKFSVNPNTFGISGPKQQYCLYTPPGIEFFGDVVEASSIANTCDKILTIAIAHTDANNGAYGTGAIVLKKK
ncbi:MAG: hypothetical protein WAT92_00625 [Saprospiraceae bacterium]|nr:hypothetical protein [Saprospiraceae bacterium]